MSLAQFYTSYLHDSVATSFRIVIRYFYRILGLPWWLSGKESACSAGNTGLIPGSGRSPGEGMATPSSLLACKVPWTEEPGGLQSMGSQRVGHDCMSKLQVWKGNVIYPRSHRGECANTGGFLPSQRGMEQRDSTRPSSRLSGQHWAWEPSPPQVAGLTWIVVIQLWRFLHSHFCWYFIVLCRFCLFFFFLIQIEGLWQPCVEHAYQCHVPHSIMFKLRSVHLKEKLMLLYI